MAYIRPEKRKYGTAYVVWWEAPPDAKHKVRKRNKTFRRRKDAKAFMGEIEASLAKGTYVDMAAGEARIGDLFEQWITGKRGTVTDGYINDLTASWRTHVEPVFAYWKVNELRYSDIQSFISGMAEIRSATITNRCLDVLRGICDMAVMDGRIAKNPCDKIKKPRRTTRKEERRYLSIAQLYRLADASGRWRPLVLTLGLTGLRCGEARALQVKDVDFKKHRLRVYKATRRVNREWVTKDTKTHARRDVPMPACVEDVLRPLCEDRAPNDLVFVRDDGKPFDEQTASRKVKNVDGKYWWFCALTTSGTPIMTMHELRHTAASIAISAGANVLLVQRMLGHENPAMTLKTYADLFDEDMNQVRDVIDANVHDALTTFTCHSDK